MHYKYCPNRLFSSSQNQKWAPIVPRFLKIYIVLATHFYLTQPTCLEAKLMASESFSRVGDGDEDEDEDDADAPNGLTTKTFSGCFSVKLEMS